jgi:AcrR family transcriptional regulator
MSIHSDPSSSKTRDALLKAALSCFAKCGYEATSIRLVASVARKNSSLISYYFKNKEGLYREVIRHLLLRLRTEIPESMAFSPAPEDFGNPARQRLHAYLQQVILEIDTHAHPLDPMRNAAARLLLIELSAPRPDVQDLLKERLEPFIREFKECVRGIRPDMKEAEIDLWGLIVLDCCFGRALMAEASRLLWGDRNNAIAPCEMAARLTTFIYYGLKQSNPQLGEEPLISPLGATHEI